ncbi:methyltransferase domain-containing protein [Methylocapsa polymorpha]|uniref:Methyltransferase domain-containing protein n=1 Tax=Methylocapsa polymorpha TaxID=3080828 RepID=A0ABZ0HRK7_9HYPH|nr:methyltransferase domain-containing protein [Methylocapsa sp. RX1]
MDRYHAQKFSKLNLMFYYIDHYTTADLRSKYPLGGEVASHDIVNVDFVDDGRPLAEITADKAPFDYVVASHVIEHVPDLVGWLKDILAVLKDGGTLALWIPDKRFTWDLFRRLSAREEIRAAYEERRARPGLRCIMDHFAYATNVVCWHLWEDFRIVRDVKYTHGPELLAVAARQYEAGNYIDVHCWVFTPWSFLDLMGWMTQEFGLYYDLQFMVQLRKNPSGKSSTDWDQEKRKALAGALWPHNTKEVGMELGIPM